MSLSCRSRLVEVREDQHDKFVRELCEPPLHVVSTSGCLVCKEVQAARDIVLHDGSAVATPLQHRLCYHGRRLVRRDAGRSTYMSQRRKVPSLTRRMLSRAVWCMIQTTPAMERGGYATLKRRMSKESRLWCRQIVNSKRAVRQNRKNTPAIERAGYQASLKTPQTTRQDFHDDSDGYRRIRSNEAED